MDVFSKLGFEKLSESVLGKRGSSGKAFSHGSIFGSLSSSATFAAEKLNTLLLRMIRKMGLRKVGSHVDFDFDHQFIPAHKFDAKYSYKQAESLYPAVCQRASKMGANRKAEHSEPIYK